MKRRIVAAVSAACAAALIVGATAGYAIAATSPEADHPTSNETPTSGPGAVHNYLKWGAFGTADWAEAALCEGATPRVTPERLQELWDEQWAELGGIDYINLSVAGSRDVPGGRQVESKIEWISGDARIDTPFLVTTAESGDSYCVVDAVEVEPSDADW